MKCERIPIEPTLLCLSVLLLWILRNVTALSANIPKRFLMTQMVTTETPQNWPAAGKIEKRKHSHIHTVARWSFLSSEQKQETARGSNSFCDTNFLRRVRHLAAELFLRGFLHAAGHNFELVLKVNSDAGFNPAQEKKTEAITVRHEEMKKKQQLVK